MEQAEVQNVVTDSIGGGITGEPSGAGDPIQNLWMKRIKKEQKCHKDFRERSETVERIFRRSNTDEELYVPLYWQVVSVEHSGVYSNQPVPDVRPRNDPQNPVMREVAMIIQRGLAYCVDQPSFDENMHRAVDDYLAMGLGIPRVKVDSIIETRTVDVPIFEDVMVNHPADPMGQMPAVFPPVMQQQQVGTEQVEEDTTKDQHIRWEYTSWSCFGWEAVNNWKHCDWIYFRHKMTQEEIRERWGRTVSATKSEKETKTERDKNTYDIYEVWDKKKREVLFIAFGEKEPLQIVPDPLELLNFFPVPTPMMMNLPSDELIPQADYDYIESYDVEINRLQIRRMGLLDQLRATGAYDSGIPELASMMENDDGEFTGIANLMQRLSAAGGAESLFYFLPLQEKAGVIQQLTEQIQFVRGQVDEVLGISDIVRGVTAASETATAQEIKGRWVGVRLTRKRECVQYTIREMMRITAQLLASHITPENLQRMTQMQISEQTQKILNDDILMEFAVDIETDSTVAKDEFREMQTKQEMLNGVAQYSQSVLPMVAQNQMPAGVASSILRSALAPYAKYDRNLEQELATLPQTMGQLQDVNRQLQEAQGQLQQAQQESQQWQMLATDLQNKATEASSKDKEASATKKKAETLEIMEGIPETKLGAPKKEAEIGLTEAQTFESMARGTDILEGDKNLN
jgi:hypothetical protein